MISKYGLVTVPYLFYITNTHGTHGIRVYTTKDFAMNARYGTRQISVVRQPH